MQLNAAADYATAYKVRDLLVMSVHQSLKFAYRNTPFIAKCLCSLARSALWLSTVFTSMWVFHVRASSVTNYYPPDHAIHKQG